MVSGEGASRGFPETSIPKTCEEIFVSVFFEYRCSPGITVGSKLTAFPHTSPAMPGRENTERDGD